jgi:hypothetical protein
MGGGEHYNSSFVYVKQIFCWEWCFDIKLEKCDDK